MLLAHPRSTLCLVRLAHLQDSEKRMALQLYSSSGTSDKRHKICAPEHQCIQPMWNRGNWGFRMPEYCLLAPTSTYISNHCKHMPRDNRFKSCEMRGLENEQKGKRGVIYSKSRDTGYIPAWYHVITYNSGKSHACSVRGGLEARRRSREQATSHVPFPQTAPRHLFSSPLMAVSSMYRYAQSLELVLYR